MSSTIRVATQDDIRLFSTMVQSTGGNPVYKANFGPFNFSNLIEYSLLCLIATSDDDSICTGFLAINDSPTIAGDVDLDKAIETLSDIFPARVSC